MLASDKPPVPTRCLFPLCKGLPNPAPASPLISVQAVQALSNSLLLLLLHLLLLLLLLLLPVSTNASW